MTGRRSPKTARLVQTVDKEYRSIVRSALDAGWTFTASRGGHPKLTSPTGESVPIPSTPSGRGNLHRSILTKLRKLGLDV